MKKGWTYQFEKLPLWITRITFSITWTIAARLFTVVPTQGAAEKRASIKMTIRNSNTVFT